MYVSIPKTENDLSFFNCFICHSSGIVTANRFIEWGIFDPSMNEDITRHNATVLTNNPMSYKYMNQTIYNTIPCNSDTDSNKAKLEYLNKRLGTNLTIQEATDNKIVLNLVETLQYNRIGELTRDPRIVQALSDNFIGFLSYDGNFINLRKVNETANLYHSINKKYINYNIHGKEDNTLKFIILPSVINTIQKVQVHIAEGAFDIFSVKYNLRGPDTANGLFAAVTGNAYKGLIRYLVSALGLIDMDLHLYLDNDEAGMYTLQDMLQELSIFPQYNVYLHLNSIGKDMGVPLSRIKENVELVKKGC